MGKRGVLKIAIVGDSSQLGPSLDDATDMLSSWGAGALGILGGIGLAGGALLVSEMGDALERAQLGDKLEAQLGVTPELGEKYGRLAGELFNQAYGESLEEVHDAVGVVVSTLGTELDDGTLERVTAKALDFAAAFDSDVSESVNTVGVLLRTGLAKDADQAFDLIVAASQRVPAAMRDELMPIIEEYAQDFAALGIDGPDAFALLIDAASRGRFELDKTGDALKELTIRTTDMSTASVEAFDALGLDAEDMADSFVRGGAEARGALDELVDALLAVEDPVERANLAIALFGTPLEDLSTTEIPAFLESLEGLGGGLEGVEGAADRLGESLNENTAWTEFTRRAGAALDTFLASTVIPVTNDIIAAFNENGVGGALNEAVEQWRAAQPAVEAWFANDFQPFWEEVAIPWMKYAGAKMGTELADGLVEALVNYLAERLEQGIILGDVARAVADALNKAFGFDISVPDQFFDIPDIDVPDISTGITPPDTTTNSTSNRPAGGTGSSTAFHGGGVVRVRGGGEGLIRAVDKERVLDPGMTAVFDRFVTQLERGRLQQAPITVQINGPVSSEQADEARMWLRAVAG